MQQELLTLDTFHSFPALSKFSFSSLEYDKQRRLVAWVDHRVIWGWLDGQGKAEVVDDRLVKLATILLIRSLCCCVWWEQRWHHTNTHTRTKHTQIIQTHTHLQYQSLLHKRLCVSSSFSACWMCLVSAR